MIDIGLAPFWAGLLLGVAGSVGALSVALVLVGLVLHTVRSWAAPPAGPPLVVGRTLQPLEPLPAVAPVAAGVSYSRATTLVDRWDEGGRWDEVDDLPTVLSAPAVLETTPARSARVVRAPDPVWLPRPAWYRGRPGGH